MLKSTFATLMICQLFLTSCLSMRDSNSSAMPGPSPEKRPNILLIVADDLGYADLGSYGGDIATPNIDSLAATGLRFSQFHTAPYCAPTRAMLLSGNNNHVAGMASQGAEGLLGAPVRGYENGLSARIAPLPRLLRDAGYQTYMVGKWHLGLQPEQSPTAAGFQRSYALLNGAGNHWDAVGYTPAGSTFWADGDYTQWPAGSYSTERYTDQLISFIEQGRPAGQPFFAFAAYTSPHWPLQVPEAELDRYRGRYDQGYDRLREQRFESLQAAGIIPANWTLPPRNPDIRPWTSLDEAEQAAEARKMELYAAMVDNLDRHVGRLLAYLKSIGEYHNTLIIFMADNGAAAEDFYHDPRFSEYLQANYDNSPDNMGKPGSFVSYGPQWAEAGSAPFARHKGYTREGGITAPMIIAGPGLRLPGDVSHAYVTVMDLAPTFLDLAETTYPQDDTLAPLAGASLLPLLQGRIQELHGEDYVTTLSHRGRALLRQGDWKLTTLNGPFDEAKLELFNLATDPGETHNLAAEYPEKYAQMLELWRSERRRLGIILPSDL